MELTTVADDEAVVHDGFDVRRYPDLQPDHEYDFDGFAFRTLARPGGEHLCTFATVNDVHFGEVECGIIEGLDIGPDVRRARGDDALPRVHEPGGRAEIEAIDPTVVIVKGDLTSRGTVEEYDAFLETYGAVRRPPPPHPRATTRATTTPPSRPTRRSSSTSPAPAWR